VWAESCLEGIVCVHYSVFSKTERIWPKRFRRPWFFFLLWRCDPTRVMASSFTRFLDHTQRRTTVGRAPLDEWSARRRDLYLTTHNTYNRQTSTLQVGLEPTISAGERPQTYALDRANTGTDEGREYRVEKKTTENRRFPVRVNKHGFNRAL
jgi:hypothetical protein